MAATLRSLRSYAVLQRHQRIFSQTGNNSTVSTCTRRFLSTYPPHEVVGLPSLSPTMDSGSIASWNLAAGDSFAAGDVLCSIETDKAVVDFEAQDEGFVAKILLQASPGVDVAIGTPILVTVEDAGDVAAFADYQASGAPAAAPTKEATVTPVATPGPTTAIATGCPPNAGAVIASPLARMLAKEMGYSIDSIPGTGPGGRIVAADVKEFTPAEVSAPTTALLESTTSPIPGTGFTDYPLTATAKDVAARLAQSKRNVPHYYLTVDVCVDALLQFRANLSHHDTSEAIGVYEYLIKAAAASMKTVPAANAAWMESVVRVYEDVDINVVTGSGDSLQAVCIPNAAAKGLRQISNELATANQNAADVNTSLGTFSMVNLGMYGVTSCAPIIREPQACALGVGALQNRIVPSIDDSNGEVYQQSVYFTATLSCDHRVVDGAVGAQWLAAFTSHVENPTTLLL